ncbi:multiple PDZ domain protein-like isoform X4 [Atheta coriaria]
MGANVSRHSSKGLSGRRSESSGSICKTKKGGSAGNGTQPQPVCGSLPSYLEASNNNHDYEKQPINDVDRIPPLGDGAPLHWKFSDNQTVLCDQGYGSERSPEDEFPPPLPEHDNQCNHHLDIHSCYPFITPADFAMFQKLLETTFAVSLAKGSRGLGLSVTGGIDSGGSWPGLIRVKRLFPHQPAAVSGVLNVGDLILEANGVALTGLTNYEALEVLRTSASQVELRVCRPPPDVLNCVSPISEVPPPPPRRELAPLPLTPDQLNISDDELNGEFEITMRKIGGSLGFTLRKEDDSALGHYIRALVRDPALNDGRIRPGDKIIAVNNVEISSMTHDEAVNFLRKCGQLVKLRLYRDAAQTPIATLSPTETTPRTSFTKKAQLRQEAMDMLNDIAVRKLLPNSDSYKSQSPLASPRRIRSRIMTCPSDASGDSAANNPNVTMHYYVPEEQFHEGLLQRGGYLPFDEESFNSLFIQDEEDGDKPPRPLSLELYNPKQTPVACRKPKFNFSLAHNAYELNNLDAEILDAPNLTYNMNEDVNSTEVECEDNYPKEPASMPHIPLSENPGFSYKNPTYQSAHPPCGSGGRENGVSTLEHRKSNSTTPAQSSNTLLREPEKKPRRKKSIIKEPKPPVPDQPEIVAIELNRGWNSRMGFSLQGPVGQTYVSAVYPNSVASKDGRVKEGDVIIRVNDEGVEHMTTSSIIDLLRILRGPVSIVMLRDPANARRLMNAQNVYKDCTSKASNAVN